MKVISFGRETGIILEENKLEDIYHEYDYSLNSILCATTDGLNIKKDKIKKNGYLYKELLFNQLNKKFISYLDDINSGSYFIIDLSMEVFDVVRKNDSLWLNDWLYKESGLDIKDATVIKRTDFTFNEWKKSADKFINIIKDKFDKRIVLHELYYSEYYLDNGELKKIPNYEIYVEKNKFLKSLYDYLKIKISGINVIKIDNYNYTDSQLYNINNPFRKNKEYNYELLNFLKEIGKEKYKFKVSVVIASYNVHEYIEEAINSVLNQSLKEVECVIVDDGSDDGTQNIIRKIANNNNRIKYKFLKNTGSPSRPRNVGMDLSSGEYIMFLDGDDYIGTDACEKMYNISKKEKADLVLGRMMSFKLDNFFESSKNISKFSDRYKYLNKIEDHEVTSIYNNPVLYTFPSSCAKLFKKSLVSGIKFDEHARYGEDKLFSIEAALMAKKSVVISEFVYYYRIRINSNTQSTTQQKSIKNIVDFNNIMKKIWRLIEAKKYKANNINSFTTHICKYNMQEIISQVNILLDYSVSERLKALELLYDVFSKWYDNKEELFSVIRHFTLYNYIILSLFFENKLFELLKFMENLNELQMHDCLNKFNINIENIDNKILLSLEDYFKIDIRHKVEEEELKAVITDIEEEDFKLNVTGIAYLNNISILDKKYIEHEIFLIERNTKKKVKLTHKYKDVNIYSTSIYKYNGCGFTVEVDFNKLDEGTYDFYIYSKILGIKKNSKIKTVTNKVVLCIDRKIKKDGKNYYELAPIIRNRHTVAFRYTKLRGKKHYIKRAIVNNIYRKKFSLRQVNRNNGINDRYKRNLKIAIILEDIYKFILKRKNIAIVGEKMADSACDAGYWFYKYCREKEKNNQVYYVIKDKCNDYKKFKGDKNIIKYYSVKHILYSMNAKYIFSNDNPNLLLPSNIKHLRNSKRVFLQHGIILPQRIDNVYNGRIDFTDYTIVSSEFEKDILYNHYGFDNDRLLNYGLARFDTLNDTSTENIIMMTFTWRKDILTLEQLLDSQYFKNITNIIESKSLNKYINDKNIKIKVALHPRVSHMLSEDNNIFNKLSNKKNIELLNFNQIDVRELIEKSKMLITDYSSIVFDFVYQEKPVINYLFDKKLDLLNNDLYPAKTVYNIKDLEKEIRKYFNTGKVSKVIDKHYYINNTERNSCKKIYDHFILEK